ncbi:MAG: EVE domain-containing protein, partial [Anaerolineales bacterium]|nr:EVE domain-containing protein [Anaerolineales bacterium]
MTPYNSNRTDLDPATLASLRRVLRNCGPFDDDPKLRAVFVDSRLSPWRDNVPEAGNASARVDALISYLLPRQNNSGENALLLFLQVLRDRANPKDSCAGQLADLIDRLNPPDEAYSAQSIGPQTYAPPSSASTTKYAADVGDASRRQAYQLLEERDSKESLERALDIFESIGDQEAIVTALGRLGDLAYREGRYEEATDYLQKALERDPQNVFANVTLAATIFRQGGKDEAREVLARASRLAPQDERVHALQAEMDAQQQRDALLSRIRDLETRVEKDERLPRRFQNSITENVSLTKGSIDDNQLEMAAATLKTAEDVWDNWDEHRDAWLSAYGFQQKLIEQIAALGAESEFRQRLSAAQRDLAGRPATTDTAEAWRRDLEQLEAVLHQYEDLQGRINELNQRLYALPADQRAPFVQAVTGMQGKLEQLPLVGAEAWRAFESEVARQESALEDARKRAEQREKQVWLVVASADRFDWRQAFASASYDSTPINWTGATGSLNQSRLREAGDGDVVLAYASASDERAIVGLGHIVGQPYDHEAAQAVNIAPDRLLDKPITLEMLRDAVPETEKVRVNQIGFAAVTPFEWSVIRELIRYHNPDLNAADLPASHTPLEYHPIITDVALPTDLMAGRETPARVTVRNRGNVTWEKGTAGDLRLESASIELRIRPATMPADIPPGQIVELAPILRPTAAGPQTLAWTYTLHTGTEAVTSDPYQMSVTVQAKPRDNAMFVSDESFPPGSEVATGSRFEKQWRVHNAGNTTWNKQYQLVFIGGDHLDGPDAASLDEEVAPGADTILSVSLTAPTEPGKRRSTWRLRNEQGQLFSDSFFMDIEVIPPEPVDDAIFLEDVDTEEGTEVAPGATFSKAWRVRNSGNTTWDDRYQLACVSDDRMGAPDIVTVPETVPPGAETVLDIPMIAPETPGKRRSTWRLHNEKEEPFGPLLFAEIQVTEAAPISAPTHSTEEGTKPTPSVPAKEEQEGEELQELPPQEVANGTRTETRTQVITPVVIGWQKLPEPPPDEGRIIVDVNDRTISLTLNNKTEFRSRNL